MQVRAALVELDNRCVIQCYCCVGCLVVLSWGQAAANTMAEGGVQVGSVLCVDIVLQRLLLLLRLLAVRVSCVPS
jgi:hypothetical protein